MSNRMTQQYSDIRRPALIREEISDLTKLINENNKLLVKYPDRISLKFRGTQFSERLAALKEELDESIIIFKEAKTNV